MLELEPGGAFSAAGLCALQTALLERCDVQLRLAPGRQPKPPEDRTFVANQNKKLWKKGLDRMFLGFPVCSFFGQQHALQ